MLLAFNPNSTFAQHSDNVGLKTPIVHSRTQLELYKKIKGIYRCGPSWNVVDSQGNFYFFANPPEHRALEPENCGVDITKVTPEGNISTTNAILRKNGSFNRLRSIQILPNGKFLIEYDHYGSGTVLNGTSIIGEDGTLSDKDSSNAVPVEAPNFSLPPMGPATRTGAGITRQTSGGIEKEDSLGDIVSMAHNQTNNTYGVVDRVGRFHLVKNNKVLETLKLTDKPLGHPRFSGEDWVGAWRPSIFPTPNGGFLVVNSDQTFASRGKVNRNHEYFMIDSQGKKNHADTQIALEIMSVGNDIGIRSEDGVLTLKQIDKSGKIQSMKDYVVPGKFDDLYFVGNHAIVTTCNADRKMDLQIFKLPSK
jgi:hypothetical protein